jgi:hypothetical protein
MNSNHRINPLTVKSRIEAVRNIIATVGEDATESFAILGDPAGDVDEHSYRPELADLLRTANGMHCGGVMLLGRRGLLEDNRADLLEGGSDRWCCVGDIADVPMFVDRGDGAVWFAHDAGPTDFMEPPMEEIAPDIWSFVGWYVFGPGYRELFQVSGQRWVDFLQEHDLFDWEDPA